MKGRPFARRRDSCLERRRRLAPTLMALRALPTRVLAQLDMSSPTVASTDDTLNVMSTFMDVIRHARQQRR